MAAANANDRLASGKRKAEERKVGLHMRLDALKQCLTHNAGPGWRLQQRCETRQERDETHNRTRGDHRSHRHAS